MDKLQPIIRNHFWILAGLVVPLVLYGYYSANSSLSAATAEREKTLDGVKSGVSSGNEPNEDYVKKLEHINTFLDASVQDAIVDLWRKQKERMVWPQQVAARIPEEFMAPFDQQLPFIYKGIYPELIRKLQARAQPVEPLVADANTNPMNRDGRPLPNKPAPTTSNQKLILNAMVPHAKFGQFGITSQEMWDAQIDIWLTEILIDAIVKMNEEKESISEAVIRRVDVIELVGGSGVPVTKDAPAAGGDGMPMDMGGMPMGGGGMMGGATAPSEVAFLPAEEFGPALEAGGGGDPGMAMSPEGGAAAVTPPKRYIAETPEAPFLERGFYLSVIIQQTKIADFIVTLANSDWPVQVRRFQVGVNPYRVEIAPTDGSFGQPGMGGMGMSMGEQPGRFGGMGMGGRFEGGMDANRGGVALQNPYAGSLPEFATGSLNHPDLVKLELCGIITMYRQPKEAMAAVEARKAAEAAAAAPAPTEGTTPDGAPVDPANPEAAPMPEGSANPEANPAGTPAGENSPAPVEGAVPAPAADGTPAAPAEGAPESSAPAAAEANPGPPSGQ